MRSHKVTRHDYEELFQNLENINLEDIEVNEKHVSSKMQERRDRTMMMNSQRQTAASTNAFLRSKPLRTVDNNTLMSNKVETALVICLLPKMASGYHEAFEVGVLKRISE